MKESCKVDIEGFVYSLWDSFHSIGTDILVNKQQWKGTLIQSGCWVRKLSIDYKLESMFIYYNILI